MGQSCQPCHNINDSNQFFKQALSTLQKDSNINTLYNKLKIHQKNQNGHYVYTQKSSQLGYIYRQGYMLYYGPIRNDKAQGKQGHCIFRFGNKFNSIYKGQFKNNKSHGYGTLQNNQMKFQGQWVDGAPKKGSLKLYYHDQQLSINDLIMDPHLEKGHIKISKHNQWTYKGQIKKMGRYYKFDGFGKMIYIDKGTYEGNWKQGQYHGKGKYQWIKQDRCFQGDYYNGKRHGRGIQIIGDKLIIQGNWVNNKKQGLFDITKQEQVGTIKSKLQYLNGKPKCEFD